MLRDYYDQLGLNLNAVQAALKSGNIAQATDELNKVLLSYNMLGQTDVAYKRLPTFNNGKVDYMFGVYVTENSASGTARTTKVKQLLDYVASSKVINSVSVFCNYSEIQQGTLPKYISEKGMAWITDTMNILFDQLTATQFEDYVKRAVDLGSWGFVVDDAHRFDLTYTNKLVGTIKKITSLPVMGSFGVAFDTTQYTMYDAIQKQMYRQGEPTSLITSWLGKYRIDVGNLECYNTGSITTSPTDLRDMYDRAFSGGMRNYMTYAFYDGGTDLRTLPNQWMVLKGCGLDYWSRIS